MLDRQQCLRILGLSSSAGPDEIHEAYRDLVRVWHPDRFGDDARLRIKAEARLREINQAHDFLLSPENGESPRGPGDQVPERTHTAYDPFRKPPPTVGPRKTFPGVAAILLAIIIVLMVVPFLKERAPVAESTDLAKMTEVPASPGKRRTHPRPGSAQTNGAVESSTSLPVGSVETSNEESRDWFTIGSTRQDVLDVQGSPTRFNGDEWRYGNSRVYFKDGRVIRWDIWPGSPLKVMIEPGHSLSETPAFVTIGSTRDEVIAVLGTPVEFTEGTWNYGGSSLFLAEGRVTGWRIRPGSPLKVRLLPGAPVRRDLVRFTLGSTKDEVLAVQGTPTEFGDKVWKYGSSSVFFADGLVTSWEEWPGAELKVHAVP